MQRKPHLCALVLPPRRTNEAVWELIPYSFVDMTRLKATLVVTEYDVGSPRVTTEYCMTTVGGLWQINRTSKPRVNEGNLIRPRKG